MRTVDDFAQIRRLHRDKLSIRAIATQLGIGRDTVRKALRNPEPAPYTLAKPRPAPTFGAFRAIVDEILAQDRTAPPKQRHTASQIFRRLAAEHNYTGGYDQVRRYLKCQRLDRRETFIPLEHPPGHRAEADFGHIYADFPEGRRPVPVLVLTWSYSNCPFALALPTERTEAVLHGLVEAFAFFGCVPRELWWDNPKTVAIRYRRQDTCPNWKPGRNGPSQMDAHRALVEEWIGRGGRNTAELHRQLGEKGVIVAYDAVRRYVNRKAGSTGKPGRRTGTAKAPAPQVPSARKLSFQFIRPPKPKNKEKPEVPSGEPEPGSLDRLRAGIPNLGTALDVASELVAMIRKEVTRPLSDWLTKAEASGVSELKTFAQGLREDEAAVSAALTEDWSNGPVEGQVNLLKFIKRSMYGRAGWRLLRARVKRKG